MRHSVECVDVALVGFRQGVEVLLGIHLKSLEAAPEALKPEIRTELDEVDRSCSSGAWRHL